MNRDRIENDNCIGEDRLLLYIRGQLTSSEQHHIEKHILNCSLCADALEGLQLIGNSDKTIEIIAGLKHQINQHIQPKQKIIPITFHWWQVAAVIVLMFVSIGGYLYISEVSKVKEHVAQIESKSNKEIPANPSSDQAITKESSVKIPANVVTPEKHNEAIVDTENNENAPATISSIDEQGGKDNNLLNEDMDAAKAGDVTKDLQKEETENFQSARTPAAEMKEQNAEPSQKTETLLSSAKKKNKDKFESGSAASTDETLNTGHFYLNQKDYVRALPYFEQSAPSIAKYYYTGFINHELKKYNAAIFSLDMVINEGNSEFYEKALWYKALSLIELDEKKQARETLQMLKSMNGAYRLQAQELYDKL